MTGHSISFLFCFAEVRPSSRNILSPFDILSANIEQSSFVGFMSASLIFLFVRVFMAFDTHPAAPVFKVCDCLEHLEQQPPLKILPCVLLDISYFQLPLCSFSTCYGILAIS